MSQRTSRKNQEDHKSNSFCLWKATDKLSLSNPERKNELLLTLSPGHWINRSVEQLVSQPVIQSVSQLVNRSVSYLVSRSLSRLVSQPVSQLVI